MTSLFEPFTLRGVTLRNRIGVSPMVQSSSRDGFCSDWHLVHLGSRAVGGAGLVITEATAVEARGRITISDLGIWKDDHIAGLRRVTDFIRAEGAVPGIQLAHGGRKTSYAPPFDANGIRPLRQLTAEEGAWPALGASPIAFSDYSAQPLEMSRSDIRDVIQSYADAARRADQAGFDWIEIHAAHGYLPHCFYSPVSNRRTDEYGGCFENRVRLVREITQAVRANWPAEKVVTLRLSHTDWLDGGWTTEDSVALARLLKHDGADLIDVSSGGNSANTVALARYLEKDKVGTAAASKPDEDLTARIPIGPGYQVPGAEAIRQGADIPVAAVGLITTPDQADELIRSRRCDMVMLARELLRDPYWPQKAAVFLKQTKRMRVPVQYYLAWKDVGEFSYQPVSAPVIG